MTEFALVIPVLMLTLFAIFEAALIMFSVGSARYASADGARIISEQGIAAQTCSKVPGCIKVYNSPNKSCDADCQAISAINLGPLGTTTIASVDEIDVQKQMTACDGTIKPDDGTGGCSGPSNGCPCVNKFHLDGTSAGTTSYPAGTRNVILGQSDLAAVTVKFHYVWKTGFFMKNPFPVIATAYIVRLEPQKFPGA
ncbi:MAG TPA: TadE family protein [Candidatus Dormibacteraeota bacterium]|jgi:hypothetical protein|nr:TadE family protein [Candidatus Dormibacteraeota bacterium]